MTADSTGTADSAGRHDRYWRADGFGAISALSAIERGERGGKRPGSDVVVPGSRVAGP